MRYVRAEKVLPPELLREVQKHHTGLIYGPGDPGFYERRNREVVRLHQHGLPTKQIAEKVFLFERRVRQIIAEDGGNTLPGKFPAENPGRSPKNG